MNIREKLLAALAKPLPSKEDGCIHAGVFCPWDDVISGIRGTYASESDDLFICALEAARDRKTFEFIEASGFAGEFALYVLSGHGLLNYGTSPRGGWPDEDVADLWDELIDKWKAYAAIVWAEDWGM